MARRSDFGQKLLDDLLLRKERMGLLPPERRQPSSSGTVTAGHTYQHWAHYMADDNSRWSFRGSGEAAAAVWFGNRNKSPIGSQEIVPFGSSSRSREHNIDLSMALAMALSNSGKLQNIEILGRKIVLHMDGRMASLSPSQQMGEVAKGVQNLNMILRACSNGFDFNRDCIEIGRDLLKGAMDLEESLKMLMTVQDASDYMVGSQRKQQKVKLLKGKEEEDESKPHEGNSRKTGSRSKFSFVRERRGPEAAAEQKKKAASGDEKSRRSATNSYGTSSKSSVQFISHCRSISSSLGFGTEAPAVSNGSHELVRFNLKENAASEKIRMPNIIAKLMGLEELPAPTESKKSIEMHKASSRSAQLKEMSKEVVKIDTQEKGMNHAAKSNFKNSRNTENLCLESKYSLESCVRNNGQIDVKNVDHKSEKSRVRKEGVRQEEIAITKQLVKGRTEHTIPEVGNSLTDHSNDNRVRKKDLAAGREEKIVRQRSTIDKIVQIESTVKISKSDDEQKSNLAISDAEHDNVGKKELIQTKELVLKQKKEAQVTAAVFSQSHNERNSEPLQQLLQAHSSQSGEGIKETSTEKKSDTKGNKLLLPSIENKRVMKSKDIEKNPNEVRGRTQSSKESFNSKKKDLVNKTGSQSKKENLKIIPDGTNIMNKSTHNHHREKKLIEQSPYKRLPSNSETIAEKIARTSMKVTVMRKPTQIESVQEVNILKVTKGDTKRESSVKVNVQNKSPYATKGMEQRSCILEELESRWKERHRKVEEIDKGSDANQELNMQQKNEIISSVNLPEDNDNMEITTCNPISGGDTKQSTCSRPLTRAVNILALMDQPIQEINVKYQKEDSVAQLPEKSRITMTECIDKCSQEDSTQKNKETQCSFTENKEEDHSRIMQLNSSKSIVYEDPKVMEVDQQEILTKDEDILKQILIRSQNFLNAAQSHFQIKIPLRNLQAIENANADKDVRLLIDCGYEFLRRKSKREEVIFPTKAPLAPSKSRNIDILIKELNSDLEYLKYPNYTEGCDYDIADCLKKMIEKDIQHWHPDMNCLWDFGWDIKEFVCLEKDEIVRDVEKHMLNGLLNELSRDLLNVSISIL